MPCQISHIEILHFFQRSHTDLLRESYQKQQSSLSPSSSNDYFQERDWVGGGGGGGRDEGEEVTVRALGLRVAVEIFRVMAAD